MTDQLPAVLQPEPSRPPYLTTPYIRWCRRSSPHSVTRPAGVTQILPPTSATQTRVAPMRVHAAGFSAGATIAASLSTTIRPFDVGEWIEQLQENHGPAGVKQQLAAVRMMFNWLITGQVAPVNPAAAVRGPKLIIKTCTTPVLDGAEWRKLIDSIPTETVRDLRDRALIATLTYSFARITAALRMKVEDLRPKGAGWQILLHEKGGKQHMMPCHHALAEALRALSMPPASPKTAKAGLSHQPPAQCDGVDRTAHGAGGRLAHDPPPRCSCRHDGADRQPYVSSDWHHRLSRQRRRARARAIDGGALKPAHDKAIRPNAGAVYAGRSRANSALRIRYRMANRIV